MYAVMKEAGLNSLHDRQRGLEEDMRRLGIERFEAALAKSPGHAEADNDLKVRVAKELAGEIAAALAKSARGALLIRHAGAVQAFVYALPEWMGTHLPPAEAIAWVTVDTVLGMLLRRWNAEDNSVMPLKREALVSALAATLDQQVRFEEGVGEKRRALLSSAQADEIRAVFGDGAGEHWFAWSEQVRLSFASWLLEFLIDIKALCQRELEPMREKGHHNRSYLIAFTKEAATELAADYEQLALAAPPSVSRC